MPWHCPACASIIRHSPVEERPRAGERYRCHVCRLELMLDATHDALAVSPVEEFPARERRPPKAAASKRARSMKRSKKKKRIAKQQGMRKRRAKKR